MKKCLFLFLLLAMIVPTMNAQFTVVRKQKTGFDPDKLIFGGGISAGFSSDYWTLGVSPQVGYRLTDRFDVGVGLGYNYAKWDNKVYLADGDGSWTTASNKYSESSVSLNLFAHYYPWKALVLSVKPELMRTWYNQKLNGVKFSTEKLVPAVVVGAGVYLRPMMLLLNYELIQNDYSPYNDNVFFSVGFFI
ncbi:PorT family protein [Dysgonomonas massiliensis]|uniref:PorT family protein n=1 Tax=Dysgonomonas massiliensis TaxID=2040292 RepID=UPI0011AFC0AE|nr:PorT family protein [Dysgonomonas massiliensis]